MSEHVAAADRAATEAADRAGVVIRELADIDAARRAAALFDDVWGRRRAAGSVLAPEMLVAMAHAGCQVTGAFVDDRLVGATAAIVGLDGDHRPLLHSHVTGVLPDVAGVGIGWALKQHQRRWALARGIDVVRWTFDPLIRRNAVFNLVKLGARVTGYEADRYGRMQDERNLGLPTDRLVATWLLTERRVQLAAEGRFAEPDIARLLAAGAEIRLAVGDDGEPVEHVSDAERLLIAIPPDAEQVRRDDREGALRWSSAVRATLGAALDAGYRVTGFAREGWYVLAHDGQVDELAR